MSMQELLGDVRWNNALYLNEKYERFKQAVSSGRASWSSLHNRTAGPEESGGRMADWIEKYFGDRQLLEERFEAEHMTFEEVRSLSEHEDWSDAYTHMEWYGELKRTFLENEDYEIEYYIGGETEEIPFFEFSRPFLQRVIHILQEGMHEGYEWLDRRRITGLVLKTVSDKVFHLSAKMLIYELNRSRLQGELKGDHPAERYKYFVRENLQHRHQILNLLIDYPVLARAIVEQTRRIALNLLTVLDRLTLDRRDLEEVFAFNLDRLEDVAYLGDSHNGGASVMRLQFASGASLMYKPRDMGIDTAFAKLLQWFNDRQIALPFRMIKSLDRSDYGWQQFIPYKEAASLEEVERFFERQGQYLAVLYALNATDMHMENIVVHGEHPFFIDLESLLHNQPFQYNDDQIGGTALEKTMAILNDSLLKTSMLPTLDANALYHSDLSGLAGDVDQVLNTYEILDKNTDTMRIKRTKVSVTRFNHLPSYRNKPINPERYIQNLKTGFYRTYSLIMESKESFVDALSSYFHGCTVRTIVRPTVSYFSLIEASSHPKYLKNALDRNLLFDMMWMIVRQDRNRKRLFAYEYYDLLHGDVPMFKTRIGDKLLFHHSDHEPIDGVYASDILTLTADKVMRMCPEDLEMQWEFAERTIQTKYVLERSFAMEKSKDRVRAEQIEGKRTTLSAEDYLLEASRIGDYIKEIAIAGDDGRSVSWISMGMDADEKLIYKSSELGLYNGVTGIAFFYLYLSKETGKSEYLEMVDRCTETAWEMIRKKMDRNVSLFTGYGSLLYLLMHRSSVCSEPTIHADTLELLDILEEMIDDDQQLDVISGCAGTLIACVDMYVSQSFGRALEVARRCGDRLLEMARPMESGIAWVTSAINKTPLSGIAHGNAGICFALARLYRVTGQTKYLDACLKGLEYEESLYNPELNNWKDLRFTDGSEPENHYVMYWCNGAPGVGIARVGIAEQLGSSAAAQSVETDIHRAVAKTIDDGFTEVSYSLCHGDMGNLELLLLASSHFGDRELEQYAYDMAGHIVRQVRKDGHHWRCGVPGRQQIPGLMLGLAGIGYQLLRLHNPDLPSVLMMEGPRSDNRTDPEGTLHLEGIPSRVETYAGEQPYA